MASGSSASRADPLASLVKVSSTVYLHQPAAYSHISPTFVLAMWMNASPRNIIFYVDQYRRYFPDARIFVLIGLPSNVIHRSEAAQRRSLEPVTKALCEGFSKLFLHAFSNSGAQQTGLLLRTYQQVTNGKTLDVAGLIMDSTPSRGNFTSAFAGLAYQIPNQWYIRIPGIALLTVLVSGGWAFEKVTGKLNVISQFNEDLLNTSLIEEGTPRHYMYSKLDGLVSWEDIVWHAAMAKSKGYEVGIDEFEGEGHCKWGKVYEERYWAIVKDLVERGSSGQRTSKL
ncbi:hypothetical protein LSUE1_G002934 [Lachnellula suecica]|uniref:Indole-diterpene biosynthesis protein PaxU n=1 Tax=Lachnellula suecica TaxID=602035 RepID=A0A8T9CDK3_9HELO|nr:hypothetical protein LSUE1_G002934 [Lachnellula suecica]